MRFILIKKCIPYIFFSLLIVLLWQALHTQTSTPKASPLIGQALPKFSLPNLFNSSQRLDQNLLQGKTSLLTVWASWCYACEAEQSTLMSISRRYSIPIYGLNYKDNTKEAKAWLYQHGNPFRAVIQDVDGDLAIDLGVIGTPETFIISPYGKIVYRHIGAINLDTWNNVFLPIIHKYQG